MKKITVVVLASVLILGLTMFACKPGTDGPEIGPTASTPNDSGNDGVSNGPAAVTGVTLNTSALNLVAGANATLSATVAPANAANKNVTWSTSSPAIATVSSIGTVTAVAPGTATITVTTADGRKTAACTVTISTTAVAVTGVTLSKFALSMEAGKTETLAATIAPAAATNKSVSWSSSDVSIVTVNNGSINAVGAGSAAITVTTVEGGKTATCAVTVTASAVTGVTLNTNALALTVGQTGTLTQTVNPSTAANKSVSWSSSAANVASVNNGVVSAVATGTATITVTTADGGKTAVCSVTVTAADNPTVHVSGVTLSKPTLSLEAGKTEALGATVAPADAANKSVSWSSGNPAVATVSNGTVTAVSAGTATITVTTVDGGKTAACVVTVTAANVAVTSVSLNTQSLSLNVGANANLAAAINPGNATNKNVSWSSSNSSVASVSNGAVTAVGAGTATITVTTADGGKTATCAVTVAIPTIAVIGVSLSKSSTTLNKGSSETLTATVAPANATNKSVSWASGNTGVATVNANGVITAVGGGTAIITVTTVDGGKTAACTVTVPSYTVTFNANNGTGTPPGTMETAVGSSITLPNGSGLSRSGYTFGGWNTNTAGTGTNYNAGSTYTPTANVTLYAKWNSSQYTVTFNANGGTSISGGTGTPPAKQTVNAGTRITLPNTSLMKSGHTFEGWNTSADGTGTNYSIGSYYTVNANTTLYANWKIIQYTITFNLNGGSGTAPSAQKVNAGSSITLPSGSGLTRSGYTFGGWNTNTSGTGTNYAAGSSYTTNAAITNTANAAVTLYVKWDAIVAYTVTYNINGGSGTIPNAQTVNAGSSITLPSGSGLSMNGYAFSGWNTSADGSGTNYNAGSSYTPTAPTPSITLYAKWNITYTVSFNANGGSGTIPNAQTVNAGSSITLPSGSGLSMNGYAFSGWNTSADGSGTNYNAGSSYTPTAPTPSITLYAKWNVAYTVSFNANGGSGTLPNAQTVNAGSSITLPSGSGLSMSGYTFGGWNTSADGSGTNYNAGASYTVNAAITLYAKWYIADGTEANPYPLTQNKWAYGFISSSISAIWYSFNITSGSTYYIFLSDVLEGHYQDTLDAKISAYAGGSVIFSNVNSAFDNPQSFTANIGQTVKIKVEPRVPGGGSAAYATGSFAVAYNTINAKPAQ